MVGIRTEDSKFLKSETICAYCGLLLRDPVQTSECGHRLCQSCVEEQERDIIICPRCSTQVSKKDLKPDRGFRNDLQTLLIICWFCEWRGLLKDYSGHLVQNHPNPICTYCEECFTTVLDFDRHQLYHCGKMTVFCPLKSLGCEGKMARAALSEHFQSKQHQNSLTNAILQIKSSVNLSHSTQNDVARLQEVDESLDILLENVAVLDEDRQRLTAESTNHHQNLDKSIRKFTKVKALTREQDASINSITTDQDTIQEDLRLMTEKINQIKTSLQDGTILWRIVDVNRKFDDARSGKVTSFYSSLFHTSSTGYKLRLQLYPNGNNDAQGTHMSLYLVIMRGEFDAILKFPFHFEIIFGLLDQTNRQKHIMNAFTPDLNSDSFQRPRSAMNPPSGITKFIPLELLEQDTNPYIRDNTMFIKAMVNFGNIQSDLFTYMFNVSPAFSSSQQYSMIQEEYEKRRR